VAENIDLPAHYYATAYGYQKPRAPVPGRPFRARPGARGTLIGRRRARRLRGRPPRGRGRPVLQRRLRRKLRRSRRGGEGVAFAQGGRTLRQMAHKGTGPMSRRKRRKVAKRQKKSPALIAKQKRGHERREAKRAKRSALYGLGGKVGAAYLTGGISGLGTTLSGLLGGGGPQPLPPTPVQDLPLSNGMAEDAAPEGQAGGIPPLVLIGGLAVVALLFLK
jgi:hypothetical protein